MLKRLKYIVGRFLFTIAFLCLSIATIHRHFFLGNEPFNQGNLAGGIVVTLLLTALGYGLDRLRSSKRYILFGLLIVTLIGSVSFVYYWGAKSLGRTPGEQLAINSNLESFMNGCKGSGDLSVQQCRCIFNELYDRNVFSKAVSSQSEMNAYIQNYLQSEEALQIVEKCIGPSN